MAKKSPDKTDLHVGQRIRMRRLMLDMSQETLAHRIGLTFQQVQKYEKGANRVGASRLQQIANALQVRVSFFFEGAPGQLDLKANAAPDFTWDFLSNKQGLALAQAFMAIESHKMRTAILHVAENAARRP